MSLINPHFKSWVDFKLSYLCELFLNILKSRKKLSWTSLTNSWASRAFQIFNSTKRKPRRSNLQISGSLFWHPRLRRRRRRRRRRRWRLFRDRKRAKKKRSRNRPDDQWRKSGEKRRNSRLLRREADFSFSKSNSRIDDCFQQKCRNWAKSGIEKWRHQAVFVQQTKRWHLTILIWHLTFDNFKLIFDSFDKTFDEHKSKFDILNDTFDILNKTFDILDKTLDIFRHVKCSRHDSWIWHYQYDISHF